MQAKVTDVLSTGYAEVVLIDENGRPGRKRFVAYDSLPKKQKARRGDVVDITSVRGRDTTNSRMRFFYLLPLILFAVGYIIPKAYSVPERVLTGIILAVMGFVIAWILNRKVRLANRQEYKIIKVVKKAEL